MFICQFAFEHNIKNMAFNHIKREPILFVDDKVNLNCVGFARDHIVLQMTNMVDKRVNMHSPLTLKLLNQFRFFLHWSCQNKLIFNVHILERKKMLKKLKTEMKTVLVMQKLLGIISYKPLPIEFFLFIKYYKCVYLEYYAY